jgi:iron complex outermembrane receptor protein
MSSLTDRLRNAYVSGAALTGVAAYLAVAPTLAVAQQGSAPPPGGPDTGAVQSPANNGALSEIIVTAQRREENLQEVPIAVAAVTAEALENTGIEGTADLPQIVPSVQMTRSGPSGLFFIRGVGTTNAAAGEEGANAVYIDNVYIGDLTQTISKFNNIERIEVLKGPQGTLFGRNATGGLIHILTRDPPEIGMELKAQIGLANYETVDTQLYVGGALTDKISADIAYAGTYQNKGWGRNLTTGEEIKVQDFDGLRSKIVFRPDDGVKFTLSGDYAENQDNLGLTWKIASGTIARGGFTGPSGYDTTASNPSLSSIRTWGVSLTGEIDLGFASLTSVSAIRRLRNHSYFDVDGGPLDFVNLDYVSTGRTFQQEVRLASNNSTPFSWQVGLFYLRSKAAQISERRGSSGVDQDSEMVTNSYAAFAEATYDLTPTTHLTGGIRYTIDDRNFDGRQTPTTGTGVPTGPTQTQLDTLKYKEVTYRIALRQDLTENINVYGSLNRGFKAGAFSLSSPLNQPVNPQFIMAYELGLKSELFDRKLRVNLAAYHYDIDDYQVRSASLGGTLLLNAATVKVDGVDMEFEAAPTSNWRLFGGVSYIDSRYGSFGGPGAEFQAPIVYPLPASCPNDLRGTRDPGVLEPGARTGGFATCFGDVSGNRTPLAPEWTASLGSTYFIPLGGSGELRLTGLYSYNSGYVFEPDNRARQGDFHLVNASIEYRPVENLGIELWGRNLTKTEYSVQKLTVGTGMVEALAPPRTYGVNFKFDF